MTSDPSHRKRQSLRILESNHGITNAFTDQNRSTDTSEGQIHDFLSETFDRHSVTKLLNTMKPGANRQFY